MTSISSAEINELLPGLEDFLRSMSSSASLDAQHRQVAHMYLEKLTQQPSDDFTDEDEEQHFELELAKADEPKRARVLADGDLLTLGPKEQWISRYYLLDHYDLICYAAENHSVPLWVSDMTNAKVQMTMVDQFECLCLQIGLADAIYLRPADSNQISSWFKAFEEAASASQSKTRRHVKSLSRLFAQLNRKKGQLVSHFLPHKSRKHYELRGFLVISLDNASFSTKYCTIVDGYFRIHKSRLNEHVDRLVDLRECTLAFPEERTRDIQFVLIERSQERIFIRGTHIYTMGRLLNSLAKYVEIQGSSQSAFETEAQKPPLPLPRRATQSYEIPVTIEKARRLSEETLYDNLAQSDGIGQFRFVIPFNHSAQSAFRRIERPRSPPFSLSSSNSTLPQTSSSSSSSSHYSALDHPRSRLMTAV